MFRDNVLLDMRMNQQAPRMAKDLLMELQEEKRILRDRLKLFE